MIYRNSAGVGAPPSSASLLPVRGRPAEFARRRELQALLRFCRSRVDPAEQGLRVGAFNRSTGLRQEDVASIAGISTRWYSALERGDVTIRNEQITDAIVRALDMDDTQRRCFYALASPPLPQVAAPNELLTPALIDFVQRHDHPALVTDVAWNGLLHNSEFAEFATEFSGHHSNVLLWLFAEPAAEIFTDIDDVRKTALSKFRFDYVNNLNSCKAEGIIGRLLNMSTQACALWREYSLELLFEPFSREINVASVGALRMSGLVAELSGGMRLFVANQAI